MSAVLAGVGAAMLVPVLKVVGPIIASLGSAALTAVFRIFVHGGFGAIDWMIEMGRELQLVQALETNSTMTGPEKLEAAAKQLLAAALLHGKAFARHEANFAVMVLLEEIRKVEPVAAAAIHDSLGPSAPGSPT
jgi:hypothetical protein